ncbi:MAG: DEAD/DEAH box helicase [Bacteriovoracaceae bacterium]|nr:DEAD/DEAH box helicase [Bacteriovoracaceae bacterium]
MKNTLPFESFNLNPTLLETIKGMGFESTSDIQEVTIEPIIEGDDIFAQAETGSGKTAAFAIPLLEKAFRDNLIEGDYQDPIYIVLSPTRELAQQTHKVFTELGKPMGVRSVCVIGGESMEKQVKQLDAGVHVVVATPGRLCDLVKQKKLFIDDCYAVVFDEADRLFDMGFKKDIEFVLDRCPSDRQLVMVSATTNIDVLNTAYKYHSDPIEIKVNQDSLVVESIDQKIAMITSEEKMPFLVNELRHQEDAYALIFCNTQMETHRVAEWLKLMGFKSNAISGRLSQNKRTSLMKEFRSREITILVCTDVAARGLDIADVNLVINYDMPQDAANYVHRVGRTARAGKTGEAISLCAPEDCEYLDGIYRLIDCDIPKLKLYNDDFAKDICKRPYIDRKTLKVVERNNDRHNSRDSRKNSSKNSYEDIRANAISITTAEKVLRAPKKETRTFMVEAKNSKKAEEAALKHFNIRYQSQLKLEEKAEGRKAYFLFGKRLTQYNYSVKPTYKAVVLPFVIEMLKLANLELYTKFSFDGRNIRLTFSGKDEKKLDTDNGELIEALEYVTRLFLYNSIEVPREVRIFFKCRGEKNRKDSGLIKLVDKMAKKVIDTNAPVLLKPMNAADRRIVHQHLDKHDKLKTTSLGEGRMKKVEISFSK